MKKEREYTQYFCLNTHKITQMSYTTYNICFSITKNEVGRSGAELLSSCQNALAYEFLSGSLT